MASPRVLPPPYAAGIQWDPNIVYDWEGINVLSRTSWAALDNDGSRHVIGITAATRERYIPEAYEGYECYLVWEGASAVYGEIDRNVVVPDSPYYVDYDWVATKEYVNQIPRLQQVRRHAAVFAHQLDVWHGARTSSDLSTTQRDTIYNVFSSIIGTAWNSFDLWETYSPTHLDTHGVFIWKSQQPLVDDIDAELCGQCDIATFPRRMARSGRGILSGLWRLYQSGLLYGVNRTTSPWSLGNLINVAHTAGSSDPTQDILDFYVGLNDKYHEALEYYDINIGSQVHDL